MVETGYFQAFPGTRLYVCFVVVKRQGVMIYI